MNRKSGFYWVLKSNRAGIAEYQSSTKIWYIGGDLFRGDDYWDWIAPEPIPVPPELKDYVV